MPSNGAEKQFQPTREFVELARANQHHLRGKIATKSRVSEFCNFDSHQHRSKGRASGRRFTETSLREVYDILRSALGGTVMRRFEEYLEAELNIPFSEKDLSLLDAARRILSDTRHGITLVKPENVFFPQTQRLLELCRVFASDSTKDRSAESELRRNIDLGILLLCTVLLQDLEALERMADPELATVFFIDTSLSSGRIPGWYAAHHTQILETRLSDCAHNKAADITRVFLIDVETWKRGGDASMSALANALERQRAAGIRVALAVPGALHPDQTASLEHLWFSGARVAVFGSLPIPLMARFSAGKAEGIGSMLVNLALVFCRHLEERLLNRSGAEYLVQPVTPEYLGSVTNRLEEGSRRPDSGATDRPSGFDTLTAAMDGSFKAMPREAPISSNANEQTLEDAPAAPERKPPDFLDL